MEKENNRVKYKFGLSELDLKDYITNLDNNVLSYLNSKNWSDTQKQEFMDSYNNLLSEFNNLLSNNTNRFSTDSFGTITDSLGIFNENPKYYYDLSGNRITSEDYNNLKDRRKNNYTPFLANREAATYFNAIGNAIKEKMKSNTPKLDTSNKFDISKLGFIANWANINNPSGGKFDLAPYIELDELKNGTRGTEKRTKYLQQELLNYLNNLESYDFSDTPFKTELGYKDKLQNAINSLNNGYNSKSIIALNQAGLSSDFLNEFFKTKLDSDLSREESLEESLEESPEEIKQKLREQGYSEDLINTLMLAQLIQEQDEKNLGIQQAQQYITDYNKNLWLNNLAKKPFLSRVNLNLVDYNPGYNESWQRKVYLDAYNGDILKWLTHELQPAYFYNPDKAVVRRGNKTYNTKLHLANNLDWAVRYGMLDSFKLLDGSYAIPNTVNYNRMSVLAYNPSNHTVLETSLLNLDSKVILDWINNYYYNNVEKHKNGGIIKFLYGGDFSKFNNYINNFDLIQKQKEEELKQALEKLRKSNNGYNPKDNITPHTELSNADMLRLSAIVGDLGSLVANFTGIGSVASAGIGATSTALNQAADMAEGLGFWESLGNNLTSYGLDAISVLPFAKAAKIPKIVKSLAKFTPYITGAISAALGLANAPEMLNSWSKITNGLNLTVADWRNIANSILFVLGGTAATGRAIKSNKKVNAALSDTHSWLKTNNGYRKVANEDIEKIKNMNSLEELNKFLKEKYGVTISKQSKLFKKDLNTGKIKTLEYYDFSKPVTLYSGDLPYTRKFGIGERAVGNLLIPSLPDIGIRNIYNKFIHPLAYKRFKKLLSSKESNTSTKKETSKTILGLPSPQSVTKRGIDPSAIVGRARADLTNYSRLRKPGSYIYRVGPSDIPNNVDANKIVEARTIRPKESLLEFINRTLIPTKSKQNKIKKEELLRKTFHPILEREYNKDWNEAIKNRKDFGYSEPTSFRSIYSYPLTTELYVTPKKENNSESTFYLYELYDKVNRKNHIKNYNLPHKQSNKKKKTSKDDRVTRKQLGGTLDITRVRKFLKAGTITLNNGIADWNSLNDPKRDILWPGSAEYSKSPLSKYVVPRLGTSDGVNNVSKSLNYSFDTASRLKSVIDRIKNNRMTTNDVSEMLRRHWGMYYTWEPLMLPIYKDLVALYLTDYQNLGFNDEIIKPNYSVNYTINSKHPTSGDITPEWKSDGLYSLITDDRRILARKSDYDNNPELLKKDIEYAKLNGYDYYLDPETDYYMLKPILSPTNLNISKLRTISDGDNNSNQNNIDLLGMFKNIDPTISYGLPRVLFADRTNRKITDLAKNITPLLLDPFTFHRYTRSDLDSEMEGEKNYANLVNVGSKPTTSSGESQDALRLEAEVKGLEARNKGKLYSNQVLRLYDELAWQQEKENAKNIHDTAQTNKGKLWENLQILNFIDLAYLSKKYNIWDTFAQELEFNAKNKLQENKNIRDSFAKSQIHNAVLSNPNLYNANLTNEELNILNSVLSGTNPSSLSLDAMKLYILAMKKVNQAEESLLAEYYNIPLTKWSNVRTYSKWSPNNIVISAKKGTKVKNSSEKIEIARIKAKIADANRFLKQILQGIDRNEKSIERLSKSIFNYIKSNKK